MKRKSALLTALAIVLSLFVACSGEAQPSSAVSGSGSAQTSGNDGEETLVVYTARSESLNNAVIENFEADTGIHVEVVTGGTGEILKRVQSEASNPQGDICWAADEAMLQDYTDCFEPYVSPEDANMLEGYKNTNGYSSPAFCDPTVFIVNTDLAGDIEINGFEDLLNPELKGRIASGDPVNSSSAFQCLIAGLYDMGNGDPMSDSAWEWVEGLIANLDGVSLNSSSQVYKGVAEGEYVVGSHGRIPQRLMSGMVWQLRSYSPRKARSCLVNVYPLSEERLTWKTPRNSWTTCWERAVKTMSAKT